MKPLNAHTRQRLFDLLAPQMETDAERRTLLIRALFDHPLRDQVDYSGSTHTFVTALIDRLVQFGKLDDGQPALWMLLETVREQVGLDQKHLIDALRPAFELPPPPRRDRIFISYSRKNERDAQRIVSNLKDAGLRVWFDREKIKGGTEWWPSIEYGITNADYFVFCLSPAAIRSSVARRELLAARQSSKPIFAIMLEECLSELYDKDFAQQEGFAEIDWLPSLHIINFTQPETYGDSLRELIQSLPGYALPDSYYLEQIDPRDLPNPFRGLEAFLEVDAPYFAGREDAVEKVLTHLKDITKPRLLAVVGASGSGKSSLVQAGVIPALRRESPFWDTLIMKPGSSPLNELADRLHERLSADSEHTRERLREQVSALDDMASELMQGKPDDARFVLMIDQFEELFTLTSGDERRQVLDALLYAVRQTQGRIQVLLTMRADFFDRLSAVPELAQLVRENLDIATDMTPEQLRRSIETPARQVGVSYEEGLVEHILEDVRSQPGSLPLLQYALKELFERKVGRRMTLDAYQALGGVKGALATRAEAIYTVLSLAEQEALRRVLLRLVEVGEDTISRRRVAQSDLSFAGTADEVIQSVLDQLAAREARLLVASAPVDDNDPSNDGQIFYEVSHEALLSHWMRLADWIAENRGDLRLSSDILTLAKAWDGAGRTDTSYLLTGGRLIAAQDWLERGDATSLQRAFVDASIAYQAQEIARLEWLTREAEKATQQSELASKRAIRNRAIAAVFAMGAVLVTVVAGIFTSANVSHANAQVADANNTLVAVPLTLTSVAEIVQQGEASVESLRLASLGQDILDVPNGNAETAALLAIQALKTGYSKEADAVLIEAINKLFIINRFPEQQESANGLAFSPDGKMVLSGSGFTLSDIPGEVILWDAATGQRLKTFVGPKDWMITSVAFAPNGKTVLTGSDSSTLTLWDIATGQPLRTFYGHTDQVTSVAFTPDGKTALSGSWDKTLILWDVATGQPLKTFTGHTDLVTSVAFTPDGKTALSGSWDKTLILWDVATGQPLKTFEDTTGVNTVAIAPNGNMALSNSGDNTLTLWKISTGEALRTFTGHTGDISSVAFAPDGKTALSGSRDNTLILWDIATAQPLRRFSGHTDLVMSVAFAPDGKTALSGSWDNTLILWDIATVFPQPLHTFGYHRASAKGAPLSAVFSPDDTAILSGSTNNILNLWDITTGKRIRAFESPAKVAHSVAFAPDGKTILSSSTDNILTLWDTATGQPLRTFSGHTASVTSVAFAPDGKTALSGSYDHTMILWDIATGQLLRLFVGHTDSVESVAFAPDGKTALSASLDKTLILWDIATGQPLRTFTGHTSIIRTAAFAPDGKTAISGSWDKTIILWDIATGQPLRIFTGTSTVITSVAFAPDGKTIASAASDQDTDDPNEIILWDVASGLRLRTFTGHTGWIGSIAFSHDSKMVITSSTDDTVRIWEVNYHDFITYACTRVFRDFTEEERSLYNINDSAPLCPQFATDDYPTITALPPTDAGVPTAVIPVWTPIASPTLAPPTESS